MFKMQYLLIIYLYFYTTNLFAGAMYNGEYHPISEFPYVVQIQSITLDGSLSFCGGTILSASWVITAAHCTSDVDHDRNMHVITESSVLLRGKNLISVEKIVVLGDWQGESGGDISLLKLKVPIEFNQYRQPIQITRQFPQVGDKITVSGYGIHHHGIIGLVLRSAQVPLVEHNYCKDKLQKEDNVTLTDKEFCTDAKEIEFNHGDSGSPAVFDDKLIGVLSFQTTYGDINGFMNTTVYYDWIMQVTGMKYNE